MGTVLGNSVVRTISLESLTITATNLSPEIHQSAAPRLTVLEVFFKINSVAVQDVESDPIGWCSCDTV